MTPGPASERAEFLVAGFAGVFHRGEVLRTPSGVGVAWRVLSWRRFIASMKTRGGLELPLALPDLVLARVSRPSSPALGLGKYCQGWSASWCNFADPARNFSASKGRRPRSIPPMSSLVRSIS